MARSPLQPPAAPHSPPDPLASEPAQPRAQQLLCPFKDPPSTLSLSL